MKYHFLNNKSLVKKKKVNNCFKFTFYVPVIPLIGLHAKEVPMIKVKLYITIILEQKCKIKYGRKIA